MALDWRATGDAREAVSEGVTFRVAPGGSSKFFLAWVDDEIIGQAETLALAQALCEAASRKGGR